MTDQNNPSHDGTDNFGDAASQPAAEFGAPEQQNPYGAPADQGQQFSAPADQNPYSAPAGQNPYSAPSGQDPYSPPAGSAPGQPNYGQPAGDQYGQPGYGAPQYGGDQYAGGQYGAPSQPQYGAAGYGVQMSPEAEVETAKQSHLFSAIGAIFQVGWIVALIFYLTNKDKGAFVRQESAASLNFQLSMLIYIVASVFLGSLLLIVFIGALFYLVWFGAWLMSFICAFMAASKVGSGGSSNYPLTIKMVR